MFLFSSSSSPDHCRVFIWSLWTHGFVFFQWFTPIYSYYIFPFDFSLNKMCPLVQSLKVLACMVFFHITAHAYPSRSVLPELQCTISISTFWTSHVMKISWNFKICSFLGCGIFFVLCSDSFDLLLCFIFRVSALFVLTCPFLYIQLCYSWQLCSLVINSESKWPFPSVLSRLVWLLFLISLLFLF